MTIQQLKCFSVMAELLHYSKAASQLYISQPSLSYSISELEKELGVPLFDRRKSKTTLTHYGEALLPHVRVALDKLDAVKAKATELLDPCFGKVNLGIIYSISFDFIPQLLERFYADKDNSNTTVSCFQGINQVLSDRLAQDELDLIIAAELSGIEVHRIYLFTQELKLVVSEDHPLAGRKEVCLEDLKDEGLISLGPSSNITGHIAKCFGSRGLKANFLRNVAECSAMGAYISSGMGIAVTPVVPSFYSTAVKIIPFVAEDKKLLGREIYLQWPLGRYKPEAVRRLSDFIVAEFGTQEVH